MSVSWPIKFGSRVVISQHKDMKIGSDDNDCNCWNI